MFDLSGKKALVTGASQGIGRAIAWALVEQGADVAIHYHTHEAEAGELAEQLRMLGRMAPVFKADARNADEMTQLWRDAEAALGGIDILVNNLGILKPSFLAMTSESLWDEIMEVNLKSAFRLSKLAAKAMSRAKRGRIVNISSQAGQMGDIMQAHYCAAKAGLIGLTKATARELAASGVTCNAVAPGFVDTAMTEGNAEAKREAQRKLVPLGRFATPREIAALVVYLASDEAAYLTGQCLAVDGGLRM